MLTQEYSGKLLQMLFLCDTHNFSSVRGPMEIYISSTVSEDLVVYDGISEAEFAMNMQLSSHVSTDA
jgi:hypothetical protein